MRYGIGLSFPYVGLLRATSLRTPKAAMRSSGSLGYMAVTVATLAAPLNCEAQQGPYSAGSSVVSISPGTFTGAELNSLSDDQLGMYAAAYDRCGHDQRQHSFIASPSRRVSNRARRNPDCALR